MFNFDGKSLLGLLGAAALTFGLGSAADAVPVSGNLSGTFGAPSGMTEPGIVYSGASTATLRWGTTTTGGSSTSTTGSSQLQVSGGPFAGNSDAGEIRLGGISWRNMSNFNTGGEWDTLLSLSINYTAPAVSGPHGNALSLNVNNTEDPSTSTWWNENWTGDVPDDISGLQFSSGAFDTPLVLGDVSIIGYIFKLDNAGTAPIHGDFTSSYANGIWVNREGNTSVLGIYAQVAPIPLPAAAWLLIGGIGGLGLVARRRKASET